MGKRNNAGLALRISRQSLSALVLFGLAVTTAKPAQAAPSSTKVMVLTSTYGVMAGTLTGLASLAFYRSPSDHLRNVAVGASLGLYTGIGLGLYLIYFDPKARSASPPSSDEDETAPAIDPPLSPKDEKKKSGAHHQPEPWMVSQRNLSAPSVFIPTVNRSRHGDPMLGVQVYF